MTATIIKADAIEFLKAQPIDSLDLVFGSPPYEEARLYLEAGENLGISRKTDDWVAWMVEVYRAAAVACRGLVAFVVAGQTDDFEWSCGPAILISELRRAGLTVRNPPIYHRVGIPGSGGPDWLRSDYEWVVCTARPGKLPWSDNTAMGAPPKWQPGGPMSYRTLDGSRVNADRPGMCDKGGNRRRADGIREPMGKAAKSKRQQARDAGIPLKISTSGVDANGSMTQATYLAPDVANPGNVIHCKVGGGLMGGDAFAKQNEAPFPERLAEFFVRSFCPPNGLCCDPFSGSGTTAAVCVHHGRNFTGCDLRQSQVDLGMRRVSCETPPLFV